MDYPSYIKDFFSLTRFHSYWHEKKVAFLASWQCSCRQKIRKTIVILINRFPKLKVSIRSPVYIFQKIELLNETDWFHEMYEATRTFYKIIKGNELMSLIRWMKTYWKTNIPHLKTFIKEIKLGYAAVKNTIIQNITNGITEGFVNKLKTVKRLMYGKASIWLLKNKLIMEHILFN